MATARLRRPSAPAERLIAEVLRAQGEFFEAIRRPSEEFLAKAIDLPATFDPLDAETIREAQLAYQRAFQQRSSERLRLGVRKAMREPTRQGLVRALRKQQRESDDPDVKVRIEQQVERVRSTPDPRRQAVTNLLETERRLARAHAAAMAGRAREASRAVQVRAESPTGAMWRRDPNSNSCEECIFLDGKLLPWEVVEQISPPRHPNCRCTLIPLGAARAQGWIRPNAKVPSVRQATHRYRRLLQETIEGAILVEAVDRGLLREDYDRRQWRDPKGRWRDMPGVSIGGWRQKLSKPRLELKEPMEGTSFAGASRKKLTKAQVHARAKQVARAMADFYGDDDPPEVHREDQYLADVGSDARFRHKGETLAGLLYGYRVARDAADPDAGVHPFRMIAHEAAHSLSGVQPGPLPGFSQTVEEGGAEILSLWFWKHRGQEMDHRDATKADGKWTEGVRTLVHSSVYRGEIAEMLRRSASLVGWDREAIIDEVEAAMRSDHSGRLRFRDASREDEPSPPGVEDTPEGMIEWLLADERVTLKGNWATSPAAEAEVRQTIGDLLDRYPVPFRHIEAAAWVDEIGQYAGKSHDTIHVSPNFLNDEHAAAREREWRGISKAGEFGRPGTIVHEFGHVLHGVLLREDRAAHDEIDAFLDEPVPGVGGKPTPRIKAGLEAPSPYGAENRYEFVAEAFTDWYFNGEEAHPSSRAIGAIIDRALKVQEAWGSTQARAKQATKQLRVGSGHEEGGRFSEKVVPAIGSGDRATGAAAVGKSDLGDGSDLFRDDGKTIFGHTIPPGLRLATPEERRQSRVPPGYPLAYVPEDRAEMENGIVGVGVDKMGRVKRFYSDSAMAKRAQQKFERIRQLTPKLDRLDNDLVRDATEDDAAAAALLVRITGMRPGSERKTGGAQEAFGATTLQARHVEIEGDTVTFDFVGKNGKRVMFPVANAVLAGALASRLEGKEPDAQLFPAVNENGLNAWLKQALGGREYKTKDLRTALATATAQARVNELSPDAVPPGKQARQKLRLSIATEISERLGNTPAEVIKSYVDPGVWNALGL